MRKEKSNNNDTHWDQPCLPRPATPSRSSPRVVTPLPQIKGLGPSPNSSTSAVRSGKSDLSMQEVQRLAQLKEQALQRSSLHCSGSDMHVPPRVPLVHDVNVRAGNKNGDEKKKKKKKRNEMAELIEAEMKMAEVAQSRAMFNRKNDALPSIGQTALAGSRSSGKLPKIERPGVNNNVLDIINKHEPNVRLTATLREISHEYMGISAKDIEEPTANNAPEVILRNEARVGMAYNGMAYDEYAKFFEDARSVSRSRSRAASRSSKKSN